MKFTEFELSEIEKLAGLLMNPEEIAIILEKDIAEFQDEIDLKGEAWKNFMKGFLLTKSKVRQSIILMAQRDSSPAQELIDRTITNLELKL